MGVLLDIIAWLLVAMASCVLLVAATPVDVEFALERAARTKWRGRIAILGGLVPFQFDGRAAPEREKPADKKSRQKRKQKPSRGRYAWRAILRASIELAGRILNAICVSRLQMNMKIGLGDPADTGVLYGLTLPVLINANRRKEVDINMTPCFDRGELTGDASAALRVTPLALAPPAVAFIWSAFVAPRLVRR